MKRTVIFEIVLIGLFASVLFVQEQALSFLPNIQFTVFLLVVFSKKLGFVKTLLIVFLHVLLDNTFMGSFNLLWITFMLIGWGIIPIMLCTIFKKVEKVMLLAILGVLFSFTYSWVMIYPSMIIFRIGFIPYVVSDIFWEILLAMGSFLSILWLYEPLTKALDIVLKLNKKVIK